MNLKKLLINIILFSCLSLQADNFGVFTYEGSYTPKYQYHPSIKVVVSFKNEQSNYRYSDTVELSSNFSLSRPFRLPDAFIPYYGFLYILDSNLKKVDSNNIGGDLRHLQCNGQDYQTFFNGNYCTSNRFPQMGTLCMRLRFNWMSDKTDVSIKTSGGNWRDEWRIYCDPELPHIDPRLTFSAPCKSLFLNNPETVRWYESASPTGPWKLAGKGSSARPVDLSWEKGTRFFNQYRYYKCAVDTHKIMNITNWESNVIGPIGFFMNAGYDSMFYKPYQCGDTSKGIHIYMAGDNSNQTDRGVRVWVWDYTNPQPVRWNFIFPQGTTHINLDGKTGIYDPWYSGPSTEGKTFRVKNGLYRIFVDFTWWNGYNCKVRYDSIWVNGPEPWGAYVKSIIPPACPGGKDAMLCLGKWSGNADDTIEISFNGHDFYPFSDTIKNLVAGNYNLIARSVKAKCRIPVSANIPEAPDFGRRFNIDTTLCMNQTLVLPLKSTEALNHFTILPSGDTLQSDSLIVAGSGNYLVEYFGNNGCKSSDTVKINRVNYELLDDFLIPTNAKLSDTVWAVNHSRPKPDSILWKIDRPEHKRLSVKKLSMETQFQDTGFFRVQQSSLFKGCTYRTEKRIYITSATDTIAGKSGLGYKSALIQSFEISPNPNDGQNFVIKVKLREKYNITVYKIDPVSGDITGDIDFTGKDYYEFTAFRSYEEGVFYLKLIAGNESKTLKVVSIP